MKKIILAVLILTAPTIGYAWSLFGSYDDCILDNVKPSMAISAVHAIKQSCRNKFPIKQEATKSKCIKALPLTTNEIKNITLQYQRDSNSFEIYNNNTFEVRRIKVEFTVKNREHSIVQYLSYFPYETEHDELINRILTSFNPKQYTKVTNIPKNATNYSILGATKYRCED